MSILTDLLCRWIGHSPAVGSLTVQIGAVTVFNGRVVAQEGVVHADCARCRTYYSIGKVSELPPRYQEREMTDELVSRRAGWVPPVGRLNVFTGQKEPRPSPIQRAKGDPQRRAPNPEKRSAPQAVKPVAPEPVKKSRAIDLSE